MNVIPPTAITAAILTSSTAIETAPAAYAGGTTYSAGAIVGVTGTDGAIACYTSLQASNTGNTPASSPTWWVYSGTTYATYAGGTTYAINYYVIDATNHLVYRSLVASNVGNALSDATKWFLVGSTNKWAQFDVLRSTPTVGASPMVTVLTPGVRINAIALMGLSATSVTITMTSGGVTVYSVTQALTYRYAYNAYDYCFKPFTILPAVAYFDLPPYANGVITITVTNTSGTVQCGDCYIGSYTYIGDVQFDAESDVLNFSTVTRDSSGVATMTAARNVPKSIQNIILPKALVNSAYDLRDALNASTAVWCGINDGTDGYFRSLLIKGFYRRFTINVKNPIEALISLELEEV
jgi:hypothetical protein